MLDQYHKAKLRSWIAQKLATEDLVVDEAHPLGGGSIQENWRVRCTIKDGRETREFVLRKDAPATIASSRPRSEAGLSHLSFAELGEEACKESLAQGSAKELTFQ